MSHDFIFITTLHFVRPMEHPVKQDLIPERSSESEGVDMGKDTKKDGEDVHFKLLDDLVNVNSLMLIAVFVGLTMATPKIQGLESRDECHAGPKEAKMLIFYEVLAFSCFFLSSVVAKVLKLHLYLDEADHDNYTCFRTPKIDPKDLMIALAACGSVAGIISVSLSIVKIIEIRIGLLSCGCRESTAAVLCLGTLVGFALLIYVVSMAIAIYASYKSDHAKDKKNESKKGASYKSTKGRTEGLESMV